MKWHYQNGTILTHDELTGSPPTFGFSLLQIGIEKISLYCRQSWNWRAASLCTHQLVEKLNVCKPDHNFICLVVINLQPQPSLQILMEIICPTILHPMFNLHHLQIHTLDPTESETSSNRFTWSSESNTGVNSQNVGYSWSHFSAHTQKRSWNPLFLHISKQNPTQILSHFCEPPEDT